MHQARAWSGVRSGPWPSAGLRGRAGAAPCAQPGLVRLPGWGGAMRAAGPSCHVRRGGERGLADRATSAEVSACAIASETAGVDAARVGRCRLPRCRVPPRAASMLPHAPWRHGTRLDCPRVSCAVLHLAHRAMSALTSRIDRAFHQLTCPALLNRSTCPSPSHAVLCKASIRRIDNLAQQDKLPQPEHHA